MVARRRSVERLRSLAAAALWPLAAASTPLVAQDPTGIWRIEEWRPGVLASVVQEGVPYSQYATSLIVIGSDGVLVVDTRDTPRAALDLLREIRARTDLPVRWVVNSHWHWDHMGGNQVFADSFPNVQIVAQANAARRIREDGEARFQEEIDRLTARSERLQRWLTNGETDDGRALSEADRQQVEDVLDRDQVRVQDLGAVRVTAPTLEVQDAWSPPGWEGMVEVRHPGPAHTDGDLIVRLPGAGVMAVGDVIEQGLPWFGDGTVGGTREVLDHLDDLLPLPGHGPVPADRSLLNGQRAFLDAACTVLERVWTSDQPVDEALLALDLDAHAAAFPGVGREALIDFVRGVLEQRANERRAGAAGLL
ncbi:MAG: MBL fold metallo-hydrolase [Gemmatimonadota bacterium]